MNFLNVGLLEILLVVLLALIIFGPNDMIKASRSLGRFMRKVVTSDAWRVTQNTSANIKNLPTLLMREAGLEGEDWDERTGIAETKRVLQDFNRQIRPWVTTPKAAAARPRKKVSSLPAVQPATENREEGEYANIASWLHQPPPETPPAAPASTQRNSAAPRRSAPSAQAPFSIILDEDELNGDA